MLRVDALLTQLVASRLRSYQGLFAVAAKKSKEIGNEKKGVSRKESSTSALVGGRGTLGASTICNLIGW